MTRKDIHHGFIDSIDGQLEYFAAYPNQCSEGVQSDNVVTLFEQTPLKARPILFIHGILCSGQLFQYHILPAIAAAGHPAYAMSLRGHGGSHGNLVGDTLSNYVQDLKACIDWLFNRYQQRPVVVGYSMGGLVAQHLAAQCHTQGQIMPMHGLCLLASVPPTGFHHLNHDILIKQPLFSFMLGQAMWVPQSIPFSPYFKRMMVNALFHSDPEPYQIEALMTDMGCEDLRLFTDASGVSTTFRSELPILVVGAQKDKLVSAELIDKTAHAYGVEAHHLPELGHAVPVEKNWWLFVEKLLHWVNTQ
ncbi:alpha/beta hydrolase [Thaumasiovibrio sp. DFM-14]|uniref:alpha/beta hydrolase n=1 Tax=Thaumasiovibrio sp. DFM-14 TaxID=3384792 RepID=UPI0039A32910